MTVTHGYTDHVHREQDPEFDKKHTDVMCECELNVNEPPAPEPV